MSSNQTWSTGPSVIAEPLLELNAVTKQFGGLTAVEAVTFKVYPGQIVSIIGPNGAGKTTVFNLITNIYRPTSGDIRLAGQSLVGLSPDKVVRRGIARTFQNIRLFNNMTVMENVLVGQHTQLKAGVLGSLFRPPTVVHEEADARKHAVELVNANMLAPPCFRRSGTQSADDLFRDFIRAEQ